VSSVLLVAHHERPEAAQLARSTAEWLRQRGHDPYLTPDDAEPLELQHLADERAHETADLAISLGGDGTMLRTVKILGGAGTPIIGVNLGQLGYLTETEPHALPAVLERWFAGPAAGEWQLDERMLLDLHIERHGEAPPLQFTALNEGVIEKREPGHTVRLQVDIDGTPFTSYAADGLILATPTGSTAYSMSARGPVLSPRLRAVLLTPVSPHMLFDRTLVLDRTENVVIEVLGHRPATLSVDGQHATNLEEGDRVLVGASEHVARFVRFGDRRFHQILKAKFGLTDR
jgi:NAD+ kinase